MPQEVRDENKPSGEEQRKKKLKPELIFIILFVGLILGAIAAMMYIDSVGEQRIGDVSKLHDVAEH